MSDIKEIFNNIETPKGEILKGHSLEKDNSSNYVQTKKDKSTQKTS